MPPPARGGGGWRKQPRRETGAGAAEMSDTGMNETSWLNRIGRWLAIATEWQKEQDHAAERLFWDPHMERHIRIATWLNWVTGVSAAVGLLGLYFLYRSVIGADQATIEANRAWVGTT